MKNKYQGLVVRKTTKKKTNFEVEILDHEFLPQGDVLIRVHYSTINYKDLILRLQLCVLPHLYD